MSWSGRSQSPEPELRSPPAARDFDPGRHGLIVSPVSTSPGRQEIRDCVFDYSHGSQAQPAWAFTAIQKEAALHWQHHSTGTAPAPARHGPRCGRPKCLSESAVHDGTMRIFKLVHCENICRGCRNPAGMRTLKPARAG